MMLGLFFFFSCTSSELPQGYWKLDGVDFIGTGSISIEGEQGYVELYSDHFYTQGVVSAELDYHDGLMWLYFPLETGQGEGQAALRFQGKEAMLPLGARRGEFEVVFLAQKEKKQDLSTWYDQAMKQVSQERDYWEEGSFLFQVDESVFGSLEKNQLLLFDEHWLTPQVVQVVQKIEGADIILEFPIEPSFHGEGGQLRINIPLRRVSVPISHRVDPMDRHFTLVPGRLTEEEEKKKILNASAKANELEERFVVEQVRNIFSVGTCEQLIEMELNELPIWKGYRLEWRLLPKNTCSLYIEPTPPQHRRHLSREFVKDDI